MEKDKYKEEDSSNSDRLRNSVEEEKEYFPKSRKYPAP